MAQELSESNFPSSFEPESTKKGKKYLLQYAKDLWKEAQAQRTTFNFNQHRDRFINNRKYAEGLQSIEKFKQQFSVDGDSTYLNFDWGVSTPLPKLAEVIRGQMINMPYKPQFIPVDSTSLTEYDREKKVLKAKMEIQEELAPLIEQGVIPKESNLPEDDDELEIYMQSNFKLAQSIAMEEITQAVLEDNDIEYLQSKWAKDLTDIKIAAARVCLDENKNIQVTYIDPVNLVTSFVKHPFFKDAKHVGVLLDMTIEDLRVIAQGQLSNEDLFDIAKNVAGRFDNPSWVGNNNREYYDTDFDWSRINKFNVRVLDFEMFSTDTIKKTKIKAKNGGYKVLVNEEPRNKKAETETKTKKAKNVYCGKYILGSDYIFDYGLKEHIIRERLNGKYSTNTSLGFVVVAPDIYDMRNKSKVEEMIPYADELIRIQLKMQQIIAKAAPAGYAINIDAVVEGLQGMGLGGMKPLDARSMRDQIGDIYFRAIREDGTPIGGGQPVITNLPNGLDNSIILLAESYNATLSRMKETVGLNDAVDSSQPDKKALIGVQKLAVAAHKNALRTLYNSYLKINEEVVRQVSILAQQLIRKGINKDKFINMVGKETVEQLDITRLTTADFAISIKMLPDEEEKAYIEESIRLSLQKERGGINLQDAFAVRRAAKEDVDKAEKLLAVREKRRAKEAQELSRQMQQENAQLQTQVAQASEQARAQTEQIKAQLEAQNLQLDKNLTLRNEKEMEVEKRKTMALELDGKIKLVKIASEVEQGNSPKESKGDDSAYDKLDMPKESGMRMASVTPTTTFK
jgi:hypothetical protein